MSIRSSRCLSACIVSVAMLIVVGQTGCCSRCGSKCTPRGLWQSPTIQATRALLLIDMPELHIIKVDGRNVRPSCVGEGNVREYYLAPGPHTIVASFRYQAPVGAGLIGAVEGKPLTLEHEFNVGREYVAVYQEHTYPKAKPKNLIEAVALALAPTKEGYWSMRIVDLADAPSDTDPAVLKAQLYCSLLKTETPPSRTN